MQDDDQPDFTNGMLQQDPNAPPPSVPGVEPEHDEPAKTAIHLSYAGRWQDVASLALSNAFLSVISLGIYSFWGRTRIRRYLWSNTSANGSPLEYHGTGGQIFLGFIVITILFALINFGSDLLQTMLIGEVVDMQQFVAIWPAYLAVTALFATLYLTFFAYVTYSVRRFWLAMTSWRGIRLRQAGRRRTLIAMALPYAALTVVTLGLAYPWLVLRTEGYAYRESYVGDRQFLFSADPRLLLKGWLPFLASLWLLAGIPLAYITILFVRFQSGDMGNEELKSAVTLVQGLPPLFSSTGLILCAVIVLPVTYGLFRARLFNVSVSALSLDGLSFRGTIRASTFISAYVRVTLMTLVIAVPTTVLLVVLAPALFAGPLGPFFILLFAAAYFMIWSYFRNIIIVHGLWKARVNATQTDGLVDADGIRQAEKQRHLAGEGLGQAFDAGFGEA